MTGSPIARASARERLALTVVASPSHPELRFYFTYSVKSLMPNSEPVEDGFHQKVLVSLERLTSCSLEVQSFLQHLDAMVHSHFSKGAVLNIFLCEHNLDTRSARFWFHRNYEVLVWNPIEPSLLLPMSHLPSLGLQSESLPVEGAHDTMPFGVPPSSCLVVWLLDQDYLHEWGMTTVVKELWDHLLDGRSCEGFLEDQRRNPPFDSPLPMELINLDEERVGQG